MIGCSLVSIYTSHIVSDVRCGFCYGLKKNIEKNILGWLMTGVGNA